MKKIFHLINGEMIIGDIEGEYENDVEAIVYNPMYIIQTMPDMMAIGFKLEDMLLFSSDDYVVLERKTIITTLTPSAAIAEYHTVAVEFNKLAVKPLIESQITDSVLNVRENIDTFNGKSKNSRFKRTSFN